MIIKFLLGIVCAIAITLIVFRLTGKHSLPYEGTDPALATWMKCLSDSTPINKIIVPGSHDAGTATALWCAETQSYTIKQQLLCGARYFDVRVHKRSENDYCIFHSFADGMDFIPVLSWFKDFIKSNPSEVLFLDFQHFKGNSQDGVFKLLTKELYDEGLLVENTSGKSDVEFLRNLTLGEVRGKCLIFYGDRSPLPAKYIFSRNTNLCEDDDISLDSYYIAALHKKDSKYLTSKAHPIYFERVKKLKQQNKNALFVLQCQQTDGIFLRGPWSRDQISEKYMTDYIISLKYSPMLCDLNILMRDFLTPKKCCDIINLNYYSGSMKTPMEIKVLN